MPGQLRCRKRKSGSQSKGSRKNCVHGSVEACPSQRSCAPASLDSSAWSGISCECELGSEHRRCSASPQPLPRQDKENQQDSMEYQNYSKLFPDDDSNQILPVEHFFGNMDTVQDFPQKSSIPSTTVSRAQRRRRYFAKEDSEDEEGREEGEALREREGEPSVPEPAH